MTVRRLVILGCLFLLVNLVEAEALAIHVHQVGDILHVRPGAAGGGPVKRGRGQRGQQPRQGEQGELEPHRAEAGGAAVVMASAVRG